MPRGRELSCSASQSSDGRKTPSNLANCCTRSWWPRSRSIWTSSPPSSTRQSTTSDSGRDQPESDDAALEAAALALGETAPDAEALVVRQGVLEALATHLAPQADFLCLAGGAALLGKEGLRIRLRAQ